MIDPEKEAVLNDQIAKGRNMQAAFDSALRTFFDDKQVQLFRAFMDCKAGDLKTLETIHHASQAMNSLQAEVQGVIDSGKISTVQKERENLDN